MAIFSSKDRKDACDIFVPFLKKMLNTTVSKNLCKKITFAKDNERKGFLAGTYPYFDIVRCDFKKAHPNPDDWMVLITDPENSKIYQDGFGKLGEKNLGRYPTILNPLYDNSGVYALTFRIVDSSDYFGMQDEDDDNGAVEEVSSNTNDGMEDIFEDRRKLITYIVRAGSTILSDKRYEIINKAISQDQTYSAEDRRTVNLLETERANKFIRDELQWCNLFIFDTDEVPWNHKKLRINNSYQMAVFREFQRFVMDLREACKDQVPNDLRIDVCDAGYGNSRQYGVCIRQFSPGEEPWNIAKTLMGSPDFSEETVTRHRNISKEAFPIMKQFLNSQQFKTVLRDTKSRIKFFSDVENGDWLYGMSPRCVFAEISSTGSGGSIWDYIYSKQCDQDEDRINEELKKKGLSCKMYFSCPFFCDERIYNNDNIHVIIYDGPPAYFQEITGMPLELEEEKVNFVDYERNCTKTLSEVRKECEALVDGRLSMYKNLISHVTLREVDEEKDRKFVTYKRMWVELLDYDFDSSDKYLSKLLQHFVNYVTRKCKLEVEHPCKLKFGRIPDPEDSDAETGLHVLGLIDREAQSDFYIEPVYDDQRKVCFGVKGKRIRLLQVELPDEKLRFVTTRQTTYPTGVPMEATMLIPGIAAYMEEDHVDNVPLPEKEEGADPEIDVPVVNDEDKDPHDDEQVDICIVINDNTDPTSRDVDEAAIEASGDDSPMTTKEMSMEQYRTYIHSETARILRTCDYYNTIVVNDLRGLIGQESIGGMIKNGLAGIANTMGHLVNLFKSTVLHGFKDFKRSELSLYLDSNMATMQRMYVRDNYPRVTNLDIPTPRGMMCPYGDALQTIKNCLKNINMVERSKDILAVVESVEKDIRSTNPNFKYRVGDMNRKLTSNEVKRAFTAESRCFTSRKDDMSSFGKQFGSMEEFKATIADVVAQDSEFRAVTLVYENLQKIDESIGSIVPYAGALQRNQLDDLIKMTRSSAELFDMYSIAIQDLNRLNHNLTVTIQQARAALEM